MLFFLLLEGDKTSLISTPSILAFCSTAPSGTRLQKQTQLFNLGIRAIHAAAFCTVELHNLMGVGMTKGGSSRGLVWSRGGEERGED
jgi:hypothetical protein